MSEAQVVESTRTEAHPGSAAATIDGGLPGFRFPDEASALLRSCVHCGLCLGACPTYRENGNENDSPRGRLYLMKGLAGGKISPNEKVCGHLDLCLGCRACETACPSGVQYGRILEEARDALNRQRPPTWPVRMLRAFVFEQLFPRHGLMSFITKVMRFMQRSGLRGALHGIGLMRLLPSRLREIEAMQPDLKEVAFRENAPDVFEAVGGAPAARVAFFSGCVMDLFMGDIHRATVRVMQAHGIEVLTVKGQACCGALMFHAGDLKTGHALARKNLEMFKGIKVDAIVNNSAGCGSSLKEYGEHFPGEDEAQAFAQKVKDVSEVLVPLELRQTLKPIEATVCYDAPCHLLHAQRISEEPEAILRRIPSLSIVPLPDAEYCCGAAGIYNLTQPEMSGKVLERKIEAIRQTGAQIVVTGNPGCLLQIRQGCKAAGLACEVLHPMELFARALPE